MRSTSRRRPARRPLGGLRLGRTLARLLASLFAALGIGHAAAQLNGVLPPPALHALPTGGQVLVGSGQITQSGARMVITQSSARMGIDWFRFDIGAEASVEFRQPGPDAVALNRVLGGDPSQIYGRLAANGQVFLVNPAGVLFGRGAKVDVGGLVASTLDLSQGDFAAGRFRFAGVAEGSVVNRGSVAAAAGGYVALLSQHVDNAGDIEVPAGQVVLASGRAATVSISGHGLISAVIDPASSAGSVLNSGAISADGGSVRLSAHSAEALAGSLVNNTGIVRAQAIVERNGEIWITGDHAATSGRLVADAEAAGRNGGTIVVKGDLSRGSVDVSGSLSARATAGRGGEIETSAAQVRIRGGTEVSTLAAGGQHGRWTIDPTDFTVSAGDGSLTQSGIGANTLSNALNNGSVVLATATTGNEAGDLFVRAPVSWSRDNATLTLQAWRNVEIHAGVAGTGAGAGLVVSPNQGGAGGSFTLGPGGRVRLPGAGSTLSVGGVVYSLLRSIDDVQAINASAAARAGSYALADDIDASATAAWNSGAGFVPIGNNANFSSNNSFRGRFDGLGNTLSGLVINRPQLDNVGLFGTAHDATIANLRLSGASIAGRTSVGGVVGFGGASSANATPLTLTNVHADGAFSAPSTASTSYLGGLVGHLNAASAVISRSSSSGTVTIAASGGDAGGIAGWVQAGSIDNTTSSAGVGAPSLGNRTHGGLVGEFDGAGTLRSSSASGAVSNASYAGGLVGYVSSTGLISDVAATGAVSGSTYVGGLIGDWDRGGSITRASASGGATGTTYVGGLIGRGYQSGTLTDVVSSGNVVGDRYIGGLVGWLQQSSLVGTVADGSRSSATVGNGPNASSTVDAGGLVGYYTNSNAGGRIENVLATGNVTIGSPFGSIGGLIGYMDGAGANVIGAEARGRVDAAANTATSRQVGGLVGYASGAGSLTRVSASGEVRGGAYTGGLVGYMGSSGSIDRATATGAVRGNATGTTYVGGLVGFLTSSGSVSNSQASGSVATNWDGGGLIGYWASSGSIVDSQATGHVTAPTSAASVGGLVGYGSSNAAIDNSSAGGNVTGGTRAGGLVGYLINTNVDRGTASGRVSVVGDSGAYVGGLIGDYSNSRTDAAITNSSASGEIAVDTPWAYVGGLAGEVSGGRIAGSTASGRVTARDGAGTTSSSHLAGGLVGYFSGTTIADSSASGAVTGRYMTGGLVGQYNGSGPMSNVSASGAVRSEQNLTDTYYAGGLVGYLSQSGITTGFASGDVSSVSSATGFNGYVGGLVGYMYLWTNTSSSTVSDSRASGNVSGGAYTGGLIGYVVDYANVANTATILNSQASGKVDGNQYAGGLVGFYTYGTSGAARGIRSSQASGDVSARIGVGGLVGHFEGYGGIRDSLASGNVSGLGSTSQQYLGGLVGRFNNYNSTAGEGVASGNAATGRVSLAPTASLTDAVSVFAGGLIGYVDGPGATVQTVLDSYATGAVDLTAGAGRMRAGGLVGFTDSALARTYATGAVTATGLSTSRLVGGLVAQRSGTTVTALDSYWATDSSGQATSALGSARTLAELRSIANYASTSWSIAAAGGSSATWRLYEGLTTPLLRSRLAPLTLALADVTKVYDGTSSLGSGPIVVGNVTVTNPERILVAGAARNAGSYAIDAGNLYSTQNGYDLSITGSATLTIGRRTLTLDGLVNDKVYDGTTVATVSTSPRLGGLLPGEDLVFQPGSGFAATFASKHAGSDRGVTLSGNYTFGDGVTGRAANYQLPTGAQTTADILQAPLMAGSFSATSRTYDGTTTVAVSATPATLSGVIAGDSVTVDLGSVSSGTMADKHVGTGKAVTVLGAALTGPDAANYRLAGIDTVTVDITTRPTTVNGITAADRTYNAATWVTLNTDAATLSGVVAGDQVAPRLNSLNASIADKNVGNGKPVTISGLALRGVDARNYSVQQGSVQVNISPYPLTVSIYALSSSNRVYDGTTNAAIAYYTSWWGNDDLSVAATSVGYADKNVAYGSNGQVVAKTITASGLSLAGNDAPNYTLQNTSATTSGTITPKPLGVSGVTAVDRIYDGTRDVTVSIGSATVDTSAVIAGDQVTVATPPSGNVTGQMADKNVGTNKPVTVPGLTLTGADAGNYTITGGGGVRVNIARKPVTVTYTALDKIYDGDIYATMNTSSADFVGNDSVTSYVDQSWCGVNACGRAQFAEALPDANGNYVASRHAGTDRPVVIRSNFLVGTDAGNYTLLNPNGVTSADITPKAVTLVFSGGSRVYDGDIAAPVTLNRSSSGIYSGDTLTTAQDAVFTGNGAKNVGSNKPIAVSNIVLGGTHAGNYTVANVTATASGSVTPKPVTVSGITAVDRAYDGTTVVAVQAGNVGSSGFVAGDQVAVALPPQGLTQGTIANKNVGVDKPVTVTGLTLSGLDAPNYTIDPNASGITVDITPAALTPTFNGVDRIYNGGILASVVSTTAGIASGDTVTFSQQAVFTGPGAKNVGSNKPIAVSNITLGGSDAANYSLATTSASATAAITPKPVTATYTGGSRVYNGLADVSAAVVGNSLQFVAGDQVGLTQTARFTGDGSAGVNKPVSISGIALAGGDAANYTLLNSTASTTATITPRPLGVTGITATNRTYDGTTTVAVNVSNATVDTSAVIAGDDVRVTLPPTGISSGEMADRHAGGGKAVAITGLALQGTAAANYALVGATGLSVNIAPRGLTASWTGVDKIYDGSADATVVGSSQDILAVDAGGVGLSAQGVFDNGRRAGVDKAITVSGGFLTGAWRDNYTLANPTGAATATIAPRQLTLSYSGGSRVYDGSVVAPVTANLGNRVTGDVVATTQSAEFTGPGARNAGSSKPIAISGIALTGADAGNYTLGGLSSATASGTITPRPITVGGLSNVTAVDRVYDGTTRVSVNVPANVTLTPDSGDIVAGDHVTIAVPPSGLTSGTMLDKHVGTGKTVNVDGLTLSGTDAGNYVIEGTAGIRVNIAPRSLTATYAGVNRIYDGTAVASATGSSADVLVGDSVQIGASGVFRDGKNVGVGKTIDLATASLSGSDARNYQLANPTGTATADVVRRTVTPVFTGGSRVYDGSVVAPVSGGASGFVVGDDIRLDATAVFSGPDAKNVGTGKAVSVSGITLAGSDAGNYALTGNSAATTASITPRPITLRGLQGVNAVDRSYDGTRTVGVQVQATGPVSIDPADIVAGDDVAVAPVNNGLTTGTMADKHVGQGKAVTVDGLSLTGNDARNYSVAATSGVTVNISPRQLTASYVGASRVYDGTTVVGVSGTSTDVLAGDAVTIGASGEFTGPGARNVGSGKPIAVVGGALAGLDARNYTLLNPTGSAVGEITPRTVSAAFTGGIRVYDGTTTAPVTGSIVGLVAGDAVALAQTAVFSGPDARNVGDNKAIAISAITLSGTDAANYSLLATTASASGGITPRPITLGGLSGITATSRVYDGTRTVQLNVAVSGPPTPAPGDIIAGDEVQVSTPSAGPATGTMADKHAGLGKAVVVDGLTLTGRDSANYRIAGIDGVTVDIAPRGITASYAGASRVYDGGTAIDLVGQSAGIVAGDALTITGQGRFVGTGARNVGIGKPIEVSGATLGGVDARNYTLLNPVTTTTGDITPRLLGVTYLGVTREYDRSAQAAVQASLGNLVTGDDVTLSQSAVFTGPGARNAGIDKPIAISGITLGGADAGNYALGSTSASTTGTITPKRLTISGLSGLSAVDRLYDGTRTVAIQVGAISNLTGDVIAGDDVTISAPANGLNAGLMADKHVGTAKPVTVSGLVLGGVDAANYEIGPAPGLTVNITPRPLQLDGVAALARVYDGSRDVAIDTRVGVLGGALAGDDVRLPATGLTGQVADKNAGLGKAVTVSGLALAGSDAGNYSVATPGLRVDITPRTLNVTGRALDRAYDGSTAATLALDSDRIAGDALQLVADASFADKNAGRDKPVTLGRLVLEGADAANYQLGNPALQLLASITPAPLTITPRLPSDTKLYGDTFDFTGARFETTALVAGESVTAVSMSSAGAAAAAGVSAIPYAVTLSDARGTNFDPANYAITYAAGRLTVLPRPLVVAGNSVVRFEGEPNPPSLGGYFVNEGGLVNGDRLAGVRVTVPPASINAPGGSEFRITPSDATFASGDPANYALAYADGLLLVVPRPQTGGGGGFQVEIDRDQLERSLRELERLAAERSAADGGGRRSGATGGPRATLLPAAEVEALAATITLESNGGGPRVTLPQLLRMPLISFDPALRRLIFGADAAPTER